MKGRKRNRNPPALAPLAPKCPSAPPPTLETRAAPRRVLVHLSAQLLRRYLRPAAVTSSSKKVPEPQGPTEKRNGHF
ncbi:hypothetical protein R6Z07F_001761 [Ovis aries]